MPPKSVKKTPPSSGSASRRGRGGKATPKSQNKVQPEIEVPVKVFEPVKVEEPMVVDAEEEKVKAKEEEKKSPPPPKEAVKAVQEKDTMPVQEVNSDDEESISVKTDGVKEPVDEYDKGEQLDLDDNDPEYEPEEYGGVDYDEKETEHEDFQDEDPGEGDVGEEEEEEEIVEEEIEEEIHEKVEGEGVDDKVDDKVNNNVVEEHAQLDDHAEEEEHHDVVKERRKRKEFEIFVGGLDKETTEDELRKVFSAVGEVTEVRLMMNHQTKKNKGFAFLRFATVEQAKRACSELKTPVVHGRKCGVKPSQDSDTLFLGNICKTWTKEALRDKLKHYGVDNLEELTLVEDNNSEGTNQGFAFLEFSSRSDAMETFKRLQKRDVVFGVDKPAKVSFADSFVDPGDEIMAQVKTIFVDGLHASWDEDQVRGLLKAYGEIEKVELARNMPSAKRRDFGFVTFSTHDAAVICAKGINNEDLGEEGNKAKVRARLSRPLERDKRKHVTHADARHVRGPVRDPVRSVRGGRDPWSRPVLPPPRAVASYRGTRNHPGRIPPVNDRSFKRSSTARERRQLILTPPRPRPVVTPPRRRHTGPTYPRSMKRDYPRHEEVLPPPRSRVSVSDYSRAPPRRIPYRGDDYSPRGSDYADLPLRGPSRPFSRRDYVDDSYGSPRYERPPPPYHEEHARDYVTVPGSKRTYSSMDDIPPRYADPGVRHSRPRLDYNRSVNGSQYGDVETERIPRSSPGYPSSRISISSQDPRSIYSRSRQNTSYGGAYASSDLSGGGYSAPYASSDYPSRGSDVGGSGSSYSSLYTSSRAYGGGGGGGSGSSYY